MKRNIYIFLFVVLGAILQFLAHALIEMWYIGLLLADFLKYGFGLTWDTWVLIHNVLTVVFFLAGAWIGYKEGIYWWRKIYEENILTQRRALSFKSKILIFSALILLFLLYFAFGLYFPALEHIGDRYVNRACTMEAKQCPDGSYVGRTGPRCEFAECPNVEPSMFDISDWQTYRNEKYGFELRYPPVYSACEFPINEKELFNLIIGRSNSEEYPDPCDAGVYLDGVFLSIFTDSVENIRGKYKSYDKFSEERRLINDLAWSIFRFELGTPLPS